MRHSLGFTLAEVLITLTIIGVIAAITIPTLMKNYEKRQIEVGLVKTYQELSNIIKRSEIDNGPFEDWEFGSAMTDSEKYIDKYFAPYMPKLEECKDKCFSGKSRASATYYAGYLLPDGTVWNNVSPTYFLPDSRTIQFYNFSTYYTGYGTAKHVHIVVDVNGKRGKSVLGQDVFMFSLTSLANEKGFFPGNAGPWSDKNYDTKTLYSWCGMYSNPNGGWKCAVILQRNGWKFPDDYPIKF